MTLPQQPTEEVIRFAFAQVTAGVRPFDVQRQLVANGWDPQTAAVVMNHVRQAVDASKAAAFPTPLTSQSIASPPHQSHQLPSGLAPLAPFGNAGPVTTAAPGGKLVSMGKIPWTVYRDLTVGGIFLFAGVTMAAARFHPIGSVFAILFGLIQIIRGAVIAALSQYNV